MLGARVALVTALALVATGCAGMLEVTPTSELVLDPPAETSLVLAADGSVLAELHGEQDRELVTMERIPEPLRDAVVAVEDARFYDHGGVDARAVARALVENVSEGRVAEGGSTITQQLAKNTVTGAERTVERKLGEASVALQLEARHTKQEILERYLNTVYFGHGAYGVQTAARTYFARDVEDLGLAESALLAALLKAPASYDPYAAPERAVQRRDLVLGLMAEQGLVAESDAAAARAEPLSLAPAPGPERWRAPYFVAHVLKLLQHDPGFAALGEDPVARANLLFRGGLRIETTLRPDWQAAAEAAVSDTLTERDDPRAALVAIDPDSGDLTALVGGRDYYDAGDPHARFNLATDGARQPGSTFKELVLAAALQRGHTLDEAFPGGMEARIPLPGAQKPWVVRNYGDRDFGELDLRTATALSVNVVYARLMESVGPQAVVDLAHAAGVRRRLQPYESLALGAQEVSPLEMASVQATFAAGGIYRAPVAVTRILGAEDEVLWERTPPKGVRVMDEGVAWLTTEALRGVVRHGTGVRADLRRPVAGKTGTTQAGADAWFVGYTPDLAAAVWIGFPEGQVPMVPPRTRIPVEGGTWPAELFARFGMRALDGLAARDFPDPGAALVALEVEVTRNCLPTPHTPPELVAERTYAAGTEPAKPCSEPAGPLAAEVPDVVGLPVDAALRVLDEAGFAVVERSSFNRELAPGYVLRQEPVAGPERVLEGGWSATVWVSSAEAEPVAVPDAMGLELPAARALLEEAGFVVEAEERCPGGEPTCPEASSRPAVVWEQSPSMDVAVPPRTPVRLSAYPTGR